MYDCLEQIVVDVAELVRPPERLFVWEAAERYIQVNNPGNYVGPYRADITAYMKEPMEVLTSTEYTGMIFVGPAQCGKTDVVLSWMGYSAKCDPADLMVIQPTQASARDFSKRRIDRLFRNSPDVHETVLPGRQNQNTFDTQFKNGMMVTLSWPTISELSGKPVPRLWLSDYDRMPQNVDGEGSPFDLAKKRATTFRRFGMTVAESSPGYAVENPKWISKSPHEAPPTEGILALYNRGDRRRWHWDCPACDNSFEPDFELIHYPDTSDHMEAAENAWMACPHCGNRIEHRQKAQLNRNGRWVKDTITVTHEDGTTEVREVRADIASFWLKGAAAAFADWKVLVLNYLKAAEEYEKTGSEEALKTTVNTDQGLPYLPKKSQTNWLPEEMKAKALDLGEKVVPEGVRFLVATIDVQKRKFVVQVHGVGVGGDTWIVDRFDISRSKRRAPDDETQFLWVDPGAYPEDWHLIVDEVLLKSYPLDDGSGRRMQIKVAGSDSGGQEGVTTNAYAFWRWLRDECEEVGLERRFILIKGSSNRNAPRIQVSFPDSDRKDRKAGARGEVPVLMINSNQIKDQAMAMLDRKDPFGGRVSFPIWLPDSFYSELTAETRHATRGWENPKRQRNESWDLLAYSIALCLWRPVSIEQIDWSEPPSWASEWDSNDLVFEEETGRRFGKNPGPRKSLADLGKNLG